MRKLLLWASALCFFAIICGQSVASAAGEVPAGKSVAEQSAQKSRALAKDDRGAASNPVVVGANYFSEDWWPVGISFLALLVAFFQLLVLYKQLNMFRTQLNEMGVANGVAKDAAEAARAALNASNPPQIRISNPQIWRGKGEPYEREVDAAMLDQGGVFSARVYAINEGGGPAHIDTDVGMDGNVCIAWFSDRGDDRLPMFRPYKFESKIKPHESCLKKNINATTNPESQKWVDRNPNEDGYLTMQPGEFARWDLKFSVEKPSGEELKKTLYLMGIVVYWCLSGRRDAQYLMYHRFPGTRGGPALASPLPNHACHR